MQMSCAVFHKFLSVNHKNKEIIYFLGENYREAAQHCKLQTATQARAMQFLFHFFDIIQD